MTTTTKLRDIDLDAVTIQKGGHDSRVARRDKLMCSMELAAFMAGEPHSDHPKCACLVITRFVTAWNDRMDDADRQMLKPFLPRIIGTKSTPEVEERRGIMCVDFRVRISAPAFLRFGGEHGYPWLAEHADALLALSPIVDLASARAARPVTDAAYRAATAARRAAWAAGAAGAAGAAWAAGAAGAAWAAWAAGAAGAAWAAEAAEAAGAAGAAAKAMRPTVEFLQREALALLDRMIECGTEDGS